MNSGQVQVKQSPTVWHKQDGTIIPIGAARSPDGQWRGSQPPLKISPAGRHFFKVDETPPPVRKDTRTYEKSEDRVMF